MNMKTIIIPIMPILLFNFSLQPENKIRYRHWGIKILERGSNTNLDI